MFATLLAALFSVVHSSDGGVDDFATTALLAAAEKKAEYDFSAVILTNGDCEPLSALAGYRKTMKLLGVKTAVGLAASRVWNPFPWTWRMDSEKINALPILQGQRVKKGPVFGGDALLIKCLKKAEKVKLVGTGPLTALAEALKSKPGLHEKVAELHWMGGAIDVQGNLRSSPEYPTHLLNDKAEWNVFCDPGAAAWVFENTTFPIYLYPLDLSDRTEPGAFTAILREKKQTVFSRFVDACYGIVAGVREYKMGDVAAAAGILFPAVFAAPVQEKLKVVVSGREEGALLRDENGRAVWVYFDFKEGDPKAFYQAAASALGE